MDLRLYVDAFWTSPYAMSCFVALEELGVPFATETVGLHTRDQDAAWFQGGSLTGRVPALRHGDLWISESSAIDEYLAEAFAPPAHPRLLPEGIPERARARQLMAWIRSDLMPIRDERSTYTIFYAPTDRPLTPVAEAAAARLLRVATAVIPANGGPLFGAWCLADTDLAVMLNRLVANGHDVPAVVRTYVEGQWARRSVRRWVERERPTYVPY